MPFNGNKYGMLGEDFSTHLLHNLHVPDDLAYERCLSYAKLCKSLTILILDRNHMENSKMFCARILINSFVRLFFVMNLTIL
jgi:hypothetical protein